MNEHVIPPKVNGVYVTGIYRNRYGSQEIMTKFSNDTHGIVYERHITINKYNWSKWKPVKSLTEVDTSTMWDLLNDGYKFNYKEGIAIG